jgi:glycosyltransferase involved in cell wall biosynthesis
MNEIKELNTIQPVASRASEQPLDKSLGDKRIAIVSYSTLFQVPAGMVMKVQKTVHALTSIGVNAKLVNLVEESLSDFDLVHVFGAFNGNDRLVQHAKGLPKPVVMSPIMTVPFSQRDGQIARLIDRSIGKLTGWRLSTTYRQERSALDGADILLALGASEKETLMKGYQQPESKIETVPNGVGEQFFTATPDLFLKTFGISKPVVLHVGNISDQKNQLGLVRALRGENVEIVLVGASSDLVRPYLEQCISEGDGKVRYLGVFPHGAPLLTSAYAAAAVLAVPSQYEGMSNCVLEALAAGTPVVTTKHNSWDFKADAAAVIEVDPASSQEIRNAVIKLLRDPKPRARCQAIVSPLSWTSVAQQIETVYSRLLCVSTNI